MGISFLDSPNLTFNVKIGIRDACGTEDFFIHFYPLSSTFIQFHPLSSISSSFIHFHPCSSIFIHFHPVSSTSSSFIHFIQFHPLSSMSSTFCLKITLFSHQMKLALKFVPFFRVLQQNTNQDYDITFSRSTHAESTSIVQKGNRRSHPTCLRKFKD